MVRSLNILIPTYARPASLAVTLTSLCSQTYRDFDVIISDQTEAGDPFLTGEVQTAVRVLRLHGNGVTTLKHLPRRGIAENRQFLLEQSSSFYVLYLDDDLILEPDIIGRLMAAMSEERCGFAGCAPIGLSYLHDERPWQQAIQLWDRRVEPERIVPDSAEWQRHHLHNAANILHVQRRLNITAQQQRTYRPGSRPASCTTQPSCGSPADSGSGRSCRPITAARILSSRSACSSGTEDAASSPPGSITRNCP
jgi:glycosyltransferase involved in cell wall biosynthesis